MKGLILLFVVFNVITFAVFGYDKFLARAKRQRISEKTLLTLVMAGGSVGAVFAQKIFRHKTQKYPRLFWIILVIQLVIFEASWIYANSDYTIF